ncbi:hypothetical protein CFB52_000820 [Burkholderia sp. AU18528]|nr:hypothetical protein CFB52_000820 [Burkholderia sp. AU18528]
MARRGDLPFRSTLLLSVFRWVSRTLNRIDKRLSRIGCHAIQSRQPAGILLHTGKRRGGATAEYLNRHVLARPAGIEPATPAFGALSTPHDPL